jgi:DNA repair photolyase
MEKPKKPVMRKLTSKESAEFWERVMTDPVMRAQVENARLSETNIARMKAYFDQIRERTRQSMAERRMNAHNRHTRRPPHH